MVQAVLLLRVSTEEIEGRIRSTRGVRNLFRPGSPWELGVLIEADEIDELMSITEQIRSSFDIGQSDLFIKPEEEGMKLKAGSPSATTHLFEEVSTSLRRKRERILVKNLPPTSEDSQRLAEDVLQLDFTKIVSTLRSNELTAELKRAPRDSTRKLTLALYELFLELSKSYEGPSMAKEALLEISQEFERLSGASQETYLSKLQQLTKELGRLVEVRNVYLRNARAAGFEQDFVNLIRGGRTSDE